MAYTQYTDGNGTTITNYGYIRYIWDWFRTIGLKADAVAALMGNLYSESFCVPYIMQGNTTYPFSDSWNYTLNVSDGTISEYNFVHNGPNGGGYGLAQWTYSTRKQGLYNMFVDNGYATIGDKELACKYLWSELNSGFYNVLQYLKNTSYSMKQKTIYVLKNFENPSDQGTSVQNLRYSRALCIYEYMNGTSYQDPEDDHSGEGGGSGGGNAELKGSVKRSRKGKIYLFLRRKHYNKRRKQWQ
jgi:hypothetical protein